MRVFCFVFELTLFYACMTIFLYAFWIWRAMCHTLMYIVYIYALYVQYNRHISIAVELIYGFALIKLKINSTFYIQNKLVLFYCDTKQHFTILMWAKLFLDKGARISYWIWFSTLSVYLSWWKTEHAQFIYLYVYI